MSLASVLTIIALTCVYVGERLMEEFGTTVSVVGVLIFFGAVGLRLKSFTAAENDGIRFAHRRLLDFLGVILVAGVLYLVSTSSAIEAFGFQGEMATRWSVVFSSLWPIAMIIGLAGTLVIDNVIQSSPVVLPTRQVKRAMSAALVSSFVLAIIFPLNFVADVHNKRWDLSYFQTSTAGSATQAMVAQSDSPLIVRVFQSPSSEVGIELMDYFQTLEGPNLKVELLDLPAEPELSTKLRVRDNGYVAVSTEAIEAAPEEDKKKKDPTKGATRAQVFKVGTEIDARETKDKLRTLDQEFQQAVLKLSRGQLNAYFSSGHGELTWKGGDAMRKIKALQEGLKQYNYRVKELAQSDGFAQDIPNNADVLVILGPDLGLSELEVDSVKRYLERGGNLLLAVEPDKAKRKPTFGETTEDATDELLKYLGVGYDLGMLASKTGTIPITKTKQDRLHLVTDRFATHPSVSTINASEGGKYEFFVSMAGALKETKKGKGKTTVTVQGPSGAWLDIDGDLEVDAEEKRESRPIAIASTGGSGENTFRAIVVSDASAFAELGMLNPGNQRFVLDGMNWLTRNESLSGETESEEDIKFQPRKEDQTWWFYLTVIGLPILLLVFGGLRLRMRYQEQ